MTMYVVYVIFRDFRLLNDNTETVQYVFKDILFMKLLIIVYDAGYRYFNIHKSGDIL